MAEPSRAERAEGGIWGLLIGDALGVPWEFKSPSEIPPADQIEMDPPPGYHRSWGSVPPGTWSDDGSQALCLLASLLERGELDVNDVADRFVAWMDRGYMTPDNRRFDIGNQTRIALSSIKSGTPVLEAAPGGERSNGNGSLMRCLPLPLWHQGDAVDLVQLAHLQSRITHPHVRSQVCCALYSLWARGLLGGREGAWSEAVGELRAIYEKAELKEHLSELEEKVRPDEAPHGEGSGYVVDCLHSARMVCEREGSFEGVVRSAIRLGNDTDTTACVAGGIAGIQHGVQGVPERWLEQLRGQDVVRPLRARVIGLNQRGSC